MSLRVTVKDLRACGICPDARKWFEARGLDWRGFVRDGMSAGELERLAERLNEHRDLAARLIASARKREGERVGQ